MGSWGCEMRDWKVTEYIALGSAGSFMLTVIYLWGYSFTLGVNLLKYFSISDYTRYAIVWLPPVCAVLAFLKLNDIICTRVERGASEEEIVARSLFPNFIRVFRKSATIIPFSFMLILAIAITRTAMRHKEIMEVAYGIWVLMGPWTWLKLVQWYAKERRLVDHWTHEWYLAVRALPVLVLIAVFAGLSKGEHHFTGPTEVQVMVNTEKVPIEGRALFILDGYVLLRAQGSGRILAVSRDHIRKLVHLRRERFIPILGI